MAKKNSSDGQESIPLMSVTTAINLFGVGSRDVLYLNKKYGSIEHTKDAWGKIFVKDEIVVRTGLPK